MVDWNGFVCFSWPESNPEFWEFQVVEEVGGQHYNFFNVVVLATNWRYINVFNLPSWGTPLYDWSAAWHKWSIIRVSASSCRHGDKSGKYVGLLLSTISAFVVNRWYCELTVILCNSRLMNWKSSSLRNNGHWAPLGIGILSVTRVLCDAVPPRLIRVWDLRRVSVAYAL